TVFPGLAPGAIICRPIRGSRFCTYMDLRSGCPFWLLQGDHFPPYPKLDKDKSCDVAILGGGITGALVAYHLAQSGIDAILLDRRQPGCGSTMASTGLLQYELDTPLH